MKLPLVPALLITAAAVRGEALITFEKDVRPILKTHCTHCHGEEEKPEGDVDLRLRRFMDKQLDGGGRIVEAGQPAKSELVKIIRSGEMPKKAGSN